MTSDPEPIQQVIERVLTAYDATLSAKPGGDRFEASQQYMHVAAEHADDLARAITAALAEVERLRAALLDYAQAHGNLKRLDHDATEVEMFRCFIRACDVLGIKADNLAALDATGQEADAVREQAAEDDARMSHGGRA